MRIARNILASVVLPALTAVAADVHVSADGQQQAPYQTEQDGFTTIQAAVDYASDGDTIRIAAGTYSETVAIDKSLTLAGSGMHTAIVDAEDSGTCITVGANRIIALRDLQLRNGQAEFGGGVHASSATLTIERLHVTNCSAGRGGGLYIREMDLQMSDSVVSYCSADTGLGTDAGKGGGLYLLYTPQTAGSTVTNTTFYGNTGYYGAAARFWQAKVQLQQCHVFANRAVQNVLDSTSASTLTAVDCLLHDNQSLYAGTIEQSDDSSVALAYLTVTGNTSRFGSECLFSDVYTSTQIWNSAWQSNEPDDSDIPPTARISGCAFSTVPDGIANLTPLSGQFTSGADGSFYLAQDAANPSVFIGAGSADCPYAIDDNTRKCFVSGPASSQPPNAGYGYPLGAEGNLVLTISNGFDITATGVTYLTYTLEQSGSPAFNDDTTEEAVGPLAPEAVSLAADDPDSDTAFFRLKGTSPSGCTVSITVQDDSQAPIAGITVDIFSSPDFTWRGTAASGTDGLAVVTTLPPGTYTALAAWGSHTHTPRYLGDTSNPQAATTFSLSTTAPTFSGTVTLIPGARFQGTVRDGQGTVVADAIVSVYNSDGQVVNSGFSGADGSYTVGGLEAGSYRLGARKTPEYQDTYWQNATELASAAVLPLADQQTTSIDLNLSVYTKISGHVSTEDGSDLYQIPLVLYTSDDYEEITYTFAEQDGSYALYAPAGSYIVSAGEGSFYVVEYSDAVQLTSLADVTNLDFSLEYGGSVSGTVTDTQGLPLTSLYVDFYVLDDLNALVWVDSTITDSLGEYISPYLPPGTYYIQAVGEPTHTDIWYLSTTSFDDALGIPVAAHGDLEDVNFQLPSL